MIAPRKNIPETSGLSAREGVLRAHRALLNGSGNLSYTVCHDLEGIV